MVLELYNTLTRKKEVFKPIHKDYVGIYSCGPTVYNYAHIGNLRTYIFNDLLKRSLIFLGYKVKHVMNITDVDDKTIKASQKNHEKLNDFTRKYEKIFFNDLNELNIIKPDYVLRATENVQDMIKMIQKLLDKGYAYKASDGIYFSISKDKNYGKLANLKKIKDNKERIKNDEYDKENPQDFALWKFYAKEDGDVFWEAPFGKGRPGWHIECSVMSTKVLGDSFDIHTGATDLIFPHHTNEIAQSQAATGKNFVNYWIHTGFLNMKEGKMSKSVGNILYLENLIEKGYNAMEYKYMTLNTHYRMPLNFSIENLDASKNAYQRLKNIISEIKNDKKVNDKYLKEFTEAIEDDFDMPRALSILWNLIRDENANGKIETIKKMDEVFGLKFLEKEEIKIPSEVKKLVDERERARKEKNWKKSDELRDKIKKLGFIVEDNENRSKLVKI
ncbi:MAG: cysteine--tRNA ligase [Nanoarchaeota archaeon]|nr:cysteine--tRNA ligase [Nanoarchaeota archaeon]